MIKKKCCTGGIVLTNIEFIDLLKLAPLSVCLSNFRNSFVKLNLKATTRFIAKENCTTCDVIQRCVKFSIRTGPAVNYGPHPFILRGLYLAVEVPH